MGINKIDNRTMVLKLFVTGNTSNSQRAITNLRKILKEKPYHNYKLKVIDILENPQIAEDQKILATPLLLRELPTPIRRITGDLNEIEKKS